MFKGASSSDGLLVLLDRRRQTPQRMLERKPHPQRLGARGNHQRKTRRREPALWKPRLRTLRTTCQGENRYGNLLRPYFLRGLGKTVVNGTMASARPSSSAITKASGTSGLPLLMASAKVHAPLVSPRAQLQKGPASLRLRHRELFGRPLVDGNKIVPWRPPIHEGNLIDRRLFLRSFPCAAAFTINSIPIGTAGRDPEKRA